MKHFLVLLAFASTSFINTAQATDVGVSVSIGQPGFYGQIDIGGYPPPRVVYRQPRVIERVYVDRPPIYLRVPPGHAKHWDKHCREYNACGERVYFVRDDWYSREYVPRYQENHRDHYDGYRGDGDRSDGYRGEQHDEHGDGYRGGRPDDHPGNGHGNERGHKH